jgi:hypothetical protein
MQRQRADDGEDDALELTPDMEFEDPEDEPGEEDDDSEGGEPEPGEDEEADSPGEGEDEGPPEIGFDDDEPAKGDNSVLRGLRERNKQLAKELSEARRASPQRQLELPEKPTLADCDYDEEKFEEALTGWHDTKRQIDEGNAEQEREIEAAAREWQADLANYNTRRAALALPDYDDSATAVQAALSLAQQAVVVKAASDPAAFTYAIGRSDARLAELAKIHDPIKLAAAIARMEGGIKIMKGKRKAPAPDRAASGSARMPGGVDKRLAELEKKADESGDRTELIKYRKQLAARKK